MPLAFVAVVLGYALGSIPIAQLVARYTKDVDLREVGSGNVGASNVWQSAERWLAIPVGLAQIAQGALAVLLAQLLGQGDGVQALSGLAAVVAHDWNAWLGFSGGRGIGQSIGVLLALTWQSAGVFAAVSLIGVVVGWIPQFVALALFAAPFGEAFFGDSAAAAWGAFGLAIVAMVKRLLGNGRPGIEARRPDVWINRLVYDRDIVDRDQWVRRGLSRIADEEKTAGR
jgi:glycerol-3-phosphate acyltransferase PlsY